MGLFHLVVVPETMLLGTTLMPNNITILGTLVYEPIMIIPYLIFTYYKE
jgi:hypothetical protein